MDSSDPLGATSTLVSSNGESEKKVLTFQSKRVRFLKTYQHQGYSLPDSIMFYVIKNPPSAEFYQKVIQTCKDFFVRNPILVVSHMGYSPDRWFMNRKKLDLNSYYPDVKFWITHKFLVIPDLPIKNKAVYQNLASFIAPKVIHCRVKRLRLCDQKIAFVDLCLFTSTAEDIYLNSVTVSKHDGSIVGIEKIVEVAVKAKSIDIHNPPKTSITSKTMKVLAEVPSFSKLDWFFVNEIPEAFDIKAFSVYMRTNKFTRISLMFEDSLSDAYKNRLEELMDEILETKVFDHKLPCLHYPGISGEKISKFYRINRGKYY